MIVIRVFYAKSSGMYVPHVLTKAETFPRHRYPAKCDYLSVTLSSAETTLD